jgi:FdhD protein
LRQGRYETIMHKAGHLSNEHFHPECQLTAREIDLVRGLNSIDCVRTMTTDTIAAPVRTVEKGISYSRSDLLAIEEPLQFCLNGSPLSITMRTPGSDLDLATGFLFTEGIVDDVGQILSMRAESAEDSSDDSGDRVTIRLKPEVAIDPSRIRRNFYTSSSCGVCGKLAMGAIEVRPARSMRQSGPQFSADLVYRLPDLLRQTQYAFDRTGGLHAAALFSPEGILLGLREDVGRHNAVDKLIGFALRDGKIPLGDSLILVSGRAGFELVQKSVMAAIPVLAAVGAPSSLAVETAQRFGMTLVGFLRGQRFNIYSGPWRIE